MEILLYLSVKVKVTAGLHVQFEAVVVTHEKLQFIAGVKLYRITPQSKARQRKRSTCMFVRFLRCLHADWLDNLRLLTEV